MRHFLLSIPALQTIVFVCIFLLYTASLAFAKDISRIASAGGDITEILFKFGVGDKVVAVDTTSVYPASVKDLPSVGYVRGLSAEGVLSTGADLLIGSDDMGPPNVMDNLAAAGMRVEFAPAGITGTARYPAKVNFIGDILGMPDRAAELIATYEESVRKIAARRAAMPRKPKVLLFLSVQDGTPFAAGGGTTGGDIIRIAGGQNMATFEGWKPMNSETIIAAAPDIIVMSSLHIQRLGGVNVIMQRPDIAVTPAGKQQNYLVMDSQMMLQFGPRSPQAMEQLINVLEVLANQQVNQ